MTATPHIGVTRFRFGVVRSALTGAAVTGVLFVACWLGTFVEALTVTHAFISLFTPQPVGSPAALVEGGLWAVAFGAATGLLVAVFHNLFAARR